jgi:uncharacterized membrane protein
MNRIKVWPHITLVAVAVGLIAAVGVGFWIKQEQSASAEELPHAARIQRVDGEVAFSDSLPNTDAAANAEWTAATPNQPFSEGDRIYTRDNSHASLAFSGRNFARLDQSDLQEADLNHGIESTINIIRGRAKKKQVQIRDGVPEAVRSNLMQETLGHLLVASGSITEDVLGACVKRMKTSGGLIGQILLASQMLDDEVLARALRRQADEKLFELFSLLSQGCPSLGYLREDISLFY